MLVIVAVVIERLRYRSLPSDGPGDEPRARAAASRRRPSPGSARRTERFVDPTTGVQMRVFVDPRTGERRYVAEG